MNSQALVDVRSTDAGIKCLYCSNKGSGHWYLIVNRFVRQNSEFNFLVVSDIDFLDSGELLFPLDTKHASCDFYALEMRVFFLIQKLK